MDAADKVLELLQEARGPVSGEHMAQKLGVTRNTVWKAVKHLREAGYEISAVTNQGYRLLSESDVLSAGNIRRQLEPQASIAAIDVRESVTSTNTVLKELAEHGGREGMVVIAQRQTMGKGRLGRSFYSPQGGGLYMSVLLRPRFSAEEALSITTAAAVAVARAIDDVTGERAMIKWVNDVYFHGRKVCGILTEASVDFENSGLHYAVLGSRRAASPGRWPRWRGRCLRERPQPDLVQSWPPPFSTAFLLTTRPCPGAPLWKNTAPVPCSPEWTSPSWRGNPSGKALCWAWMKRRGCLSGCQTAARKSLAQGK